MVDNPAAFTVADLCSDHSTDSHHVDSIGDHSTIDYVDENDDDSFIANSSLCRQHRSTIQMLNSLRKEVVEMVRSEDKYSTPKKSPQDVTIDLSKQTELSSPLVSPLLARTTVSLSNKNALIPSLSNHRVTPYGSESHPRYPKNSDDSTFCSMDYSLENDMNNMEEVVKNLERELKAENLDTVLEAIERIGKSEDPIIKNLFGSEDKDASQEGFLNEEQPLERTSFGSQLLSIIDFFKCMLIYSTDAKILIASIILCLIYKYISSWRG